MAGLSDTPPPPQEVFKNVEPSECLGSTWGKRNRPGHENVAPTVWATVVQFNRVVKCVMTSCLGDPNVTARGRAKVLERWIEVARVCGGRPSPEPWNCPFSLISSQD